MAEEYKFTSLFNRSIIDPEELDDLMRVALMGDTDIVVTTLGDLKAYIGSGGGSGGGSEKWSLAADGATLTGNKAYLAISDSNGITLSLGAIATIPLLSTVTVHAKGGQVTIDPGTFVISGAIAPDTSLSLADGETVYLLHGVTGSMEII